MAGGKYENFNLGDLTATGAGSAAECAHLEDVAVSVSGTFSATVDVEVSFDGTSFAPHPSLNGQTAPFAGTIGFPCKQVRLNVTAYTSGTLEGRGAGKDQDRLG